MITQPDRHSASDKLPGGPVTGAGVIIPVLQTEPRAQGPPASVPGLSHSSGIKFSQLPWNFSHWEPVFEEEPPRLSEITDLDPGLR